MEKRGVIESGRTPAEQPDEHVKESQHAPKPGVAELESDFRKRAAESARTALKN